MRASKVLAVAAVITLWPSIASGEPVPGPSPVPTPPPASASSAPTGAAGPAAPASAPAPAPTPSAPATPPAPPNAPPTTAPTSPAASAPSPTVPPTSTASATPPAEAAVATGAAVAGRKAVQRGSTKLVTLPLAAGSGTAGGKAVRAQLAPTAEERFTMVGVTWGNTGTPVHAEVEIRTRTGGAWTDWRPVGEEEAGGTRQATSAVYVGESDGVQVRLTTEPGALAPLAPAVILVAPVKQAADAQVAGQALPPGQQRGRAFTPQGPGRLSAVLTSPDALRPAIVMRSAWGAAPAPDCVGPDQTINAVVVHHTEGTNTYAAADSAGIVRGIQAYHMDGRGWCDIGYNFLVDRFGVIFEGRVGGINVPVHGAHAYEWNTTTAGVSLMGSYMTSLPPEAQLQAAVSLVAWKLSSYYRSPVGTLTIGGITADVISGHRQASSTDCPGQAFYDYLPTFRQRVATAMGTTQSTIQQRWLALGGGTGWVGQPYAGETEITGGRRTQFAGADIYANGQGQTFVVPRVLATRYAEIGGPASPLGWPIGDTVCATDTCSQAFQGGGLYWTTQTGAWESYGPLRERYTQLGWQNGVLGWPSGPVTCDAVGCSQGYQNGGLYWTAQTGAWENHGPIRARYQDLGWQMGALGWPAGPISCDQPVGGCWQRFQGGLIITSPQGTFHSTGAIASAYVTDQLANGRAGYPVLDIRCETTSCSQLFVSGSYVTTPGGGATFSSGAATDPFIEAIAGMAQRSQATHRVPASVTIAQAILESGWGHSTLATYAQNYFGIKCKATASPYQLGCMEKASLEYYDPANPVSVVSPFRTYASVENSFIDHGHFLATNSRYAPAFSTTTADDFIRVVAAAGYATDPAYATTVISIMQRYNLYRFDAGAVPAPVALDGAMAAAYGRAGGPSGPLGTRVTTEVAGPVSGSTFVSFDKGLIASSAASGAHPLLGAIWQAYRFDGYVRNNLGAVTTDQYVRNGLVVQDFAGGRAYVRGSAAYLVAGPVWTRYVALGAEASPLGLPAGPLVCAAGGCSQPFDNGGIYWTAESGAWESYGPLRGRYTQLGWQGGVMGWPVGPVTCSGATCSQGYQGGGLYWTAATGAWESYGPLRERYGQLTWQFGPLGLPVGPVTCSGATCSQGYQGGGLYWTAATGAWESYGPLRERYGQVGWQFGPLGLPVGPVSCSGATCSQGYQGGGLYWTAGTGAWESYGPIRARYGQLGWQFGRMGWPTGGVVCGLAGNACRQSYQGGAIWWSPTNGAWETAS